MKVAKVINNNLIRSFDENHREVLVMGRGLGYQAKPGDVVEEARIEKVYRIEDPATEEKLSRLLCEIPAKHIRVANMIINYARQVLPHTLDDSVYLSITDHLNFAIERIRAGQSLKFGLMWEIRKYYPAEYKAGMEALAIIKRELGLEMPEDEAGFLAVHLIEAEGDTAQEDVQTYVGMISDILSIVTYHYGCPLDEESLAYERFMVHLKFFITRAVRQETIENDEHLYKVLQDLYPDDFACCEKIRVYFAKEHGIYISDAEILYLAIHLHRITSQKESKKEENSK
jgi:beta-glucoside operon transcriptional antiterminator